MSDFTPTLLSLLDDAQDRDHSQHGALCTEELSLRLLSIFTDRKLAPQLLDTHMGASVTRYYLLLKRRLGKKTISDLQSELSFLLERGRVRVYNGEETILHVEVPNEHRSFFSLRSLLEEEEYQKAPSPLTIAIGRDLDGNAVFADLAKLPHLLIAGIAGSGRTVSVYALLASLLCKSTPEQVKLMLIDLKRVQFSCFEELDHLLTPVITEPQKALAALYFAVNMMEDRFALFEKTGCRSIEDYNKRLPEGEQPLPRVVIVIESLEDLSLSSPKQTVDLLCRLAVKSRAAGIHLVLCVGRCSVDCLHSMLNASIPSRLVLAQTTALDSRRVLLQSGAEQLLNNGDALYLPIGKAAPIRLQCPYVRDDEMVVICDALRSAPREERYDAQLPAQLEKEFIAVCRNKKRTKKVAVPSIEQSPAAKEADNALLISAIDLALENGTVSTALLQRRLTIGYGRATGLIDKMEKLQVITPCNGQSARTVLLTEKEWKTLRKHLEKNDC